VSGPCHRPAPAVNASPTRGLPLHTSQGETARRAVVKGDVTGRRPMEYGSSGAPPARSGCATQDRAEAPAFKAAASAAALQNGLLVGQAGVHDPGLSVAEDPRSLGRPQDVGRLLPPSTAGTPPPLGVSSFQPHRPQLAAATGKPCTVAF